MPFDFTVSGSIIHYYFIPHFDGDAENQKRGKKRTFCLFSWEIHFWSIKSQSNKLPGLGSCLHHYSKIYLLLAISPMISGDETQHCETEQTFRRSWHMVHLQILTADVQFSGSRVRPQICISNKFPGNADAMAWESHFAVVNESGYKFS